MKIYVASSWRNRTQPEIVVALQADGHEVYDFRNPCPGNTGFDWGDIDPDWGGWTSNAFIKGLSHSIAQQGFQLDFAAMKHADVCVIVQPCGRSAHLEAGWFIGAGKPVVVLLAGGEPELMYNMFTDLCTNVPQLLNTIRSWKHVRPHPKQRDTQNLLDDQIAVAKKLQRDLAEANLFVEQLREMLRTPSMIRFYSDNHLEIFSDWTGKEHREFLGATILETVANAHEAFRKAKE